MTAWNNIDQAHANALALLTASEYQERKEVLEKLTRALATEGVVWALSCSSALFLMGLVDDFHDFDILVRMESVEKLKEVVSNIGGELLDTVQKQCFTSPYYQEAMMGKVHMDLVGDITVFTYGKEYCYILEENEVSLINLEKNVNVPICPVEANLLLYGMMEGWQSRRRYKRELCYKHLKENGVQYPNILENALPSLPNHLKEVVTSLL